MTEEYWVCKKTIQKEKKILGEGIKRRVVFIPLLKIDEGDKVEMIPDGKGQKWSDYKVFVTRKGNKY